MLMRWHTSWTGGALVVCLPPSSCLANEKMVDESKWLLAHNVSGLTEVGPDLLEKEYQSSSASFLWSHSRDGKNRPPLSFIGLSFVVKSLSSWSLEPRSRR